MNTEEGLKSILNNTTYPSSNLTLAYKGVASCMSAEYATFPTTKWSYFSDGKENLDKAVKASPMNPEIRYARLLIQLNVPSFLMYNSNVTVDLAKFRLHLPKYSVSLVWKKRFIDNLLTSKRITESQKNTLTKLKNELK